MLKRLKENNPGIIIIIFVLAILLWIPSFFNIETATLYDDSFNMPLYSITFKTIENLNSPYFYIILTIILILIQTIQITILDLEFSILGNRSYLMGFIFIFLSAGFLRNNYLHPVLFSNIFLILAVQNILQAVRSDKAFTNFFQAAMFIAVGSLFYISFAYLFIFIFISILIIRSRPTKEIGAAFTGFITVFLIFGFIYYLITGNINELFDIILNEITANNKNFKFSISEFIVLGTFLFILLISSIKLVNNFSTKKINNRINFKVFLSLFFSIVIIFIFSPSASVEFALSLSVPMVVVIANYFNTTKSKRWAFIFLMLFMGVVFYSKIYEMVY